MSKLLFSIGGFCAGYFVHWYKGLMDEEERQRAEREAYFEKAMYYKES